MKPAELLAKWRALKPREKGVAVFSSLAVIAIIGILVSAEAASNSRHPEAGISSQVEQLIAQWEMNQVSESGRFVTLILTDSSLSEDPFLAPTGPMSLEFFDKLMSLSGKGTGTTVPQTEFDKTLAGAPNAILWSFPGFSRPDEKSVVKDLMKSLVLVHDAKAPLNIVSQGDINSAVIKAIRNMEGTTRDGEQIGVNKLILLGAAKARLRSFSPTYFKKFRYPNNAWEILRAFTDTRPPPAVQFRYVSRSGVGAWFATRQTLANARLLSPAKMTLDLLGNDYSMSAPLLHWQRQRGLITISGERRRQKRGFATRAADQQERSRATQEGGVIPSQKKVRKRSR